MGLFSRKDKGARTSADDTSGDLDAIESLDDAPPEPAAHEGRPVSAPLGEAERAHIAAALERVRAEGVDVDDLASIGAGYDRAYEQWRADPGAVGSDVIVDTFAVAVGEHLARHSARQWAVVTDVFGTDLGLVAAKADTVVVPHNLVSSRWMRGETGWLPGVVSHLVGLRPRPS
jgi:hypothetical protein